MGWNFKITNPYTVKTKHILDGLELLNYKSLHCEDKTHTWWAGTSKLQILTLWRQNTYLMGWNFKITNPYTVKTKHILDGLQLLNYKSLHCEDKTHTWWASNSELQILTLWRQNTYLMGFKFWITNPYTVKTKHILDGLQLLNYKSLCCEDKTHTWWTSTSKLQILMLWRQNTYLLGFNFWITNPYAVKTKHILHGLQLQNDKS